MTTVLEQKRADLIQVLRDYDAALAGERSGVRAALDALGDDTVSTIPPPPAAKPRATRQPKASAKAAKKAGRKPAGGRRKLAAPLAAHEPAKRIGKLSSKVEVKAAEDEADRKRIVEGLMAKGYSRAALGERLAPGLYDVIRRDGAIVVTWWPTEPA